MTTADQSTNKTIHLLWTGGWDSTFRLLQILDTTEYPIRPHYIIDHERKGYTRELKAMERICSLIAHTRPDWSTRIYPLLTAQLQDISPDPSILQAYKEIRACSYIGGQYWWLASYVAQSSVPRMEMCVEASGTWGPRIAKRATPVGDNEPGLWIVGGPKDACHVLFERFYLPTLMLRKEEMYSIAKQRGWIPILSNTWFCHQPVFGRYSCGTCRPCVYTLERGQWYLMGAVGLSRFAAIEVPRRMLPMSVKDRLRVLLPGRVRRFLRS